MIASNDERRLLPDIGCARTPTVTRIRIDAWSRRDVMERMRDADGFARAWREGGTESASRHPWWDVLSNLSVADFAIDHDDD